MRIKINYNIQVGFDNKIKVVRRSWPKQYLEVKNEEQAWAVALEFAHGLTRKSIDGIIVTDIANFTNVYPIDENMMPFNGFRRRVIQPLAVLLQRSMVA
jgi:hypothetical protein